ncbi:PLP-dependent aminotransferase family protein [Flavobacterium sp. ov086]|uniref:aminotransferase-like domain-containing protein n=1 Tax=Flavobacterium sp. ov086 TaxID=1761785 RepID=UPI000B6925E6|nr:PLP-dependent aminotransferase family protein [Flavobacterium sp. ov086]SNR42251.1 DNA-binding transcriptional regulator, MocR family, contains an aminotransferase domain [Flavobacterium sp. ov086]
MSVKSFRYEQVAQKIEENINILQLRTGDKAPSVRQVRRDLKVSLNTVFQAYSLLEAKGLIISRPRSGYIINSLSSSLKIPETKSRPMLPANVEITAMAVAMMKNAKENGIVNFSILAPVNEFIPITSLNKAVKASLSEAGNDNFQYPLVDGHPNLLKQISVLSLEWKKPLSPNKILITNGGMEAINLCLDSITSKGDIIAVESPTYHGILQSLERRGLKALEIKVDPQNGLCIDDLELALANNKVAACIFMPRCHNPTGSSMSEENKIRLVELLGRQNIPMIEDDCLGELSFGITKSYPAKAYDNYDNVLYCSSFSKTLAPGFRIGWVSAGKHHLSIEKLKFGSNISTNGILQDAIGKYLESGLYNKHIRKMRNDLQGQMIKYIGAINQYFPHGTKLAVPKGGLSIWIELPTGLNAFEFQKKALSQGIGICPGHIFSSLEYYENFIRLNYCPLWNNKIENAIKNLGDIAASNL